MDGVVTDTAAVHVAAWAELFDAVLADPAQAPLFFFALLFGLRMDYQLFLLAAIKERRDATGDAPTRGE